MENQNSNSSLKVIIAVLSLLLIGSTIYIFKLSNETKELQATVSSTTLSKDNALKELQELKATYDAAIAENTSMSDELIAEREKVVELMAKVEKSNGDIASLTKYKQQYNSLQAKMNTLMAEVDVLKKENQTLTTNLDSTNVVLADAKNYTQVLTTQNEELSKTVEKGSKLTVSNLKASAYKQRSSGKQVATERAGRADILKVNFTISENAIAKQGDKTYYIQVIDSKNNVLGEKTTTSFGDQTLTYSFPTTVKYENKAVEVSHDLPGKDFEKGTYFVNVFDKGELVSKSSFALK